MKTKLPNLVLVRHGETQWSLSGRHTGRSDIPLTANGESAARQLPARLPALDYKAVLTSPSQRARRTCELAGFADTARVDDDLAEWDYGRYEGLTTSEIQTEAAGWTVFRDGCPGGEMSADVGSRADTVIAAVRAVAGDVLIFSSAHFLRVLSARWLGLHPEAGSLFTLDTTSISILGYEHNLDEPVIRQWNQT